MILYLGHYSQEYQIFFYQCTDTKSFIRIEKIKISARCRRNVCLKQTREMHVKIAT